MNVTAINPFQCATIPAVHFGAGVMKHIGATASRYGTSALLVTGGGSLSRSGNLDAIISHLEDAGVTVFHATVSGEPSPEGVDETVRAYREKGLSLVIAVGGGSVVDFGKAVSAMIPAEGSVLDYLEGVGTKSPDGKKLPFLACPTTAGTGSEATKNAVLSRVGDNGFKKSLRHDRYIPDAAIIDPELSVSCPSGITSACGMDAFTQLLEAYVSTKANPITDALAESGLRYIADAIVSSATNGAGDVAVRGNMAYAAFLSGVVLANAGLGVVHGLASPVGGRFPIPHGVVCANLMGPALRLTVVKLVETGDDHESHTVLNKLARIGALFSNETDRGKLDIIGHARRLVDSVYDITDKLNIPRLGTYGMTEGDVDGVVEKADNKNNPYPLTKEHMRQIVLERI